MKDTYDVVKEIRKYENGKLDEAQTIKLFQHLIDSEIVWMLQESYGLVAKSLIETGQCLRYPRKKKITKKPS